ncbi:MAG TPA: PilT/PilU family type 4a pilus ATPase [Thermoanaerobaculia bacterium]|jgi:twitching motility protein PilT|nr:PilT/PilU family type 4a pilus ATPase [Thermoanaerobaculia bacterium]
MSSSADDALLGRLALHYKLAAEDQLQAARKYQEATGADLGAALLALGVLSPQRLAQLEAARTEVQRRQATPSAAPSAPTVPITGPAPNPAPAVPGPTAVASPASPPSRPASPAGIPGVPPAPLPALETTGVRPPTSIPGPVAAPFAPVPARATAPTGEARSVPRLERILEFGVSQGASDIHFHSGAPIRYRRHGRMVETEGQSVDPTMAASAIAEILSPTEREILERTGQVDLAYDSPGLGRFRTNVYRQARGTDAVFRVIPPKPPTLESLGMPASLAKLADFHQGLVLVTGPAGCGKSATLAALVHQINASRRDHIITIEDPIEILHPSLSCVVNQRQVGNHTQSFSRALRAALREDPDVIAIGELRDLETISLAITAAETGHLVLATLHTSSAIRTINRILGVFPPNQQEQIRTMLAESLRAVISQRLVARADGTGRVPALEILIATRAVGNLIRENKTFQLKSVLQTGSNHGMFLLDASLTELVKSGMITKEEGLRHADDPAKFMLPPPPVVPGEGPR